MLNAPGAKVGVDDMKGVLPNATRCRVKGTELLLQKLEGAIGEAPCVNPAFHGKKHRYGYFAAKTEAAEPTEAEGAYLYFHGIGRVDFDTGDVVTFNAGKRGFASPPAFVPRPGGVAEDDGWLMTWVYDAGSDKTSVVILDARKVAAGPVATVALEHRLPAVSHVEFAPEVQLIV